MIKSGKDPLGNWISDYFRILVWEKHFIAWGIAKIEQE